MKAKKKYKTYYLHTIKGRLAYYLKEQQIYYGGKIIIPQHLVKSLNQIRKEQNLSSQWRAKNGFSSHSEDYDYIIIRLPQ